MRATFAWGVFLCLAVLWMGAPQRGATDDIPEAARKDVEEARAQFAKGDAKSLAAAWAAISRARTKAPDSVDYWDLFVRIFRANKKPEAELWDKIIGPKEKAAPASTTFDLLRARLEPDPAKRGAHLEKAVAKDAKAPGPRVLLAENLRARGEETKAEELIDQVLADHPEYPDALVAKAELMIDSGLSRSAVEFAKEALAKKECPALRYALARALQKLAKDDPAFREQALEAAQKAVEGDPQPRFVAALADLLDEADKTAEAVALLKKHAERTKDPLLSGRLGQLAFRSGDYDAAAPALALAAANDVVSGKALAFAHSRRGRAKEARAAAAKVLAAQPDAWVFAVQVEADLEDPAGVRKAAGTRTEPGAVWARAVADAWEGKTAEVVAALGKEAATGSRQGEDDALLIVESRLYAKLGAKAAAARKQVLDLHVQLTASAVPEAKPGPVRMDLTTKSHGFMQRAVTYLRSACDSRFTIQGRTLDGAPGEDGALRIGFALVCTTECGRDPRRLVRFNAQKVEGDHTQLSDANDEAAWEAAAKGCTEGCAALVAGDPAKAAEAFHAAAEAEPAWHRMRLFRALAKALVEGADLPALAREALEAVSAFPDDWEGRSAAVTLGLVAGSDVSEPLKALVRHQEERAARRPERL